MHSQVQYELKMDSTSYDGTYSMVQSINLILAYMTRSIRQELTLDTCSLPFLQSFPLSIRLVGKM